MLGCEKGESDLGSAAVGARFSSFRSLLLSVSSPPFGARVTLYVPARLQACQSHTVVRTRARVVQRADLESTRGRRPCLDPLFAPSQPQRNSLKRIQHAMAPKADKKAASAADPSYDYKPDEIVRGCSLLWTRRQLSPQTA